MLGWKVMGAGMPDLMVLAVTHDVGIALSAAGTTQATATELTNADNEVSTVASGAGVILSSKFAPGDLQTVFNAGANPLKIYPPTGMKINALTMNAAMTLSINTGCLFKCLSTTKVFGVLSA